MQLVDVVQQVKQLELHRLHFQVPMSQYPLSQTQLYPTKCLVEGQFKHQQENV
ncbi:unnamed protein product [Paramecium sonneborni]|uniref:Uncharacterized protein n=1 Tax=Paramecium sonneborni TaxID=65129 RepID=A0A8S1PYK5_9CILI|nr:unnamed protein product [Paramecium sonneborni]